MSAAQQPSGLFSAELVTHLAGVQRRQVWLSMRSEDPVPPGKVLAIVARKVQMVLGMMRSRINDAVLGDEVAVVDRDIPPS